MERALAELALEELWRLFPIQLHEYDQRYPLRFAHEAERLGGLLKGSTFRLSHIGSMAVPGLLSKPIIDLLLEVSPEMPDEDLVGALEADDWTVMATSAEPYRVDLNKGYTPQGFAARVFHLHLVRPGDHDELYFRDYLREHPRACAEYAELKRRLLARFEHDRDGYTSAKAGFVTRATAHARQEFPRRHSAGRRLRPGLGSSAGADREPD